ncbi:chromate transport protein ChrA [Halobacteroides halobius DSM 5150]|uniref:Chromate transport protein ChrA n=1 Tax=Halobacteroides halobius (strain ATCC 35273 / DSM 5150 / MD-1) TaxID=748449 RepID=L0K7N3_HALHC|nr:chromate transporter [Halobacteroides halobius]AGB41031.1 chromate transport protein ChrA [Halobacteroides halobius DSM 5150]
MLLVKLFFTFMKIGAFTFGSGYAMLALAEEEVVEVHQWLSAEEFADAVSLSEMTPGPIMINLATFVGTKLKGTFGAIIASLGLIIPPIIALIIITRLYIDYKDNQIVDKIFKGLKPAVIGLIITVVIKLGRSTFVEVKSVLITIMTIISILIGLHPILAVVGAGTLGIIIF